MNGKYDFLSGVAFTVFLAIIFTLIFSVGESVGKRDYLQTHTCMDKK